MTATPNKLKPEIKDPANSILPLFLFPWAVVYQELGLLAFIEAFIFVLILVVGFVYIWAKGDLDWVKMNVRYGKGRYASLKTEGDKA